MASLRGFFNGRGCNLSEATKSISYVAPHSPALLDAEPNWLGMSMTGWLRVLIVGGLCAWLFYVPNLHRLWSKTNPFYGEPNWGHAIVVPIVGLYYLYLNRDGLLRSKIKPLLGLNFTLARVVGGAAVLCFGLALTAACKFVVPVNLIEYVRGGASGITMLGVLALLFDWGIGTLLFGLLVLGWGIYPGQNDWIKDLGMVFTIFGIVLTLCGWQVMRIAAFPILFLICAFPWPMLVYSKLASPLQEMAATAAVFVLQVTGVDSFRSGTKIFIGDGVTAPMQALNVAEACAGLRSLMTFITVGGGLAFLSNRPLWQKLVMTFSAVPIAIFCNVMRVSGQGLLHRYVSPELSQSFAHQFVGIVMLVPAFFLILGVGWVLDQMFVEESDDAPPAVVKVSKRAASSASNSASSSGSMPTTSTEGH